MSLDTEIAQLTGTASALIDTFNNKEADIGAAVEAAIKAVPLAYKTLYVDQAAGSDSNMGDTAEEPLKTLSEAFSRVPYGGALDIILLSDYTLDGTVEMYGLDVRFRPIDTTQESKVKMIFPARESGGDVYIDGFIGNFYTRMHFFFVDIVMPDLAALSGDRGNRAVLFGQRASEDGFIFQLKITYSEIICPANTGYLLNPSVSFITIALLSATYSANMAGRWVRGVNAGLTPDDVPYLEATGIGTL